MKKDGRRAIDDINRQIMWNRLLSVVEEQAQTLMRTAFSPIVRECGDLSAGIFDLKGRMLAQAVTGTPGHVNSMAESVKHFISHFPIAEMNEGDVYITNDPWMGTGHLNDFVLTSPAYHKGRLVGLFSCTSHLIDIGGIGFGPDAPDVFAEGIYIPMLKLFDRGRLNETLMAMIKANTRMPVESEGDVYSLANCNEIGARRLSDMMAEFDLDNIEGLGDFIIGKSQAATLARIARLTPGTYRHVMTIDGYDHPIDLAAAMTISEDGIVVDYEGTSANSRFGINVPLAYTQAYTCFGLSCAIRPDIPNNAGSLAPFRVTAPAGSILNAPYPVAVSSRHVVGQMLPDVVFGCLRQVIADRVPAEGTSCLWTITLRGAAPGRNEAASVTVNAVTNGGTGARADKDGLSATAYPSGVRGTPVEITEAAAPVVFWQKELRPDSGGAGRYRGGHGQIIEIEASTAQSLEILAAFDRINHPARGRDGGHDGARGALGLGSGKSLNGKGFQLIPPGERLRVLTPGGGGLGDPLSRPVEAVLADLAEGLIAPATAAEVYGVVVDETGALDDQATAARRGSAV